MYSVSTGKKTYEIAVDDVPNGVIKISMNPADGDMILRYNKFNEKLEEKLEELPDDEIELDENGNPKLSAVAERIELMSKFICDEFDEIFGYGVSKELFKYCNPMSIDNGEPFAVRIAKVIAQIIQEAAKKEQPKYEKYMRKYAK